MNSLKIALFGTSGESTRCFATEALGRGHNIKVIVPNEKYFTLKHRNLEVVSGDARKNYVVSKLSTDYAVVICTYEPAQSNPREYIDITRSVIEGVNDSGARQLVFASHPLGRPIERTEEGYNEFKPILKAQLEALKLLRNEKQLQWGYAHSIVPEATGHAGRYETSNEILYTTREGESRIPENEYVSTIMNNVEKSEVLLHNRGESVIEINI